MLLHTEPLVPAASRPNGDRRRGASVIGATQRHHLRDRVP
jgi:hypothetical protein